MAIKFLQQVNISDFLELEGNIKVDSTGYIQLPVGTQDERPSPASEGMIRYNTTTNKVEANVRGKGGNLFWQALH